MEHVPAVLGRGQLGAPVRGAQDLPVLGERCDLDRLLHLLLADLGRVAHERDAQGIVDGLEPPVAVVRGPRDRAELRGAGNRRENEGEQRNESLHFFLPGRDPGRSRKS
jgi:hypothetical protein